MNDAIAVEDLLDLFREKLPGLLWTLHYEEPYLAILRGQICVLPYAVRQMDTTHRSCFTPLESRKMYVFVPIRERDLCPLEEWNRTLIDRWRERIATEIGMLLIDIPAQVDP